jgi:DNA-binding GntR family transcriptional regulator
MASAPSGQPVARCKVERALERDYVNAPAKPRQPQRRLGRREQLSDEVAAHLRVEIMSGALRPGTFIRLDDTAAQLGVSITPVREALRTLRSEGMVQLEPHRGHVVAPFTRGDIEDVFWLQSTIATQLVRSAVERVTEAELDELESHVDAIVGAIELHDSTQIVDAEFSFYRALNRASGRIKLAWFLLHATRYLPALMYADDLEWGAQAVGNHRDLVAALRRRDVDAAVQLTNEQFIDGAQRLTQRLDELGVWD